MSGRTNESLDQKRPSAISLHRFGKGAAAIADQGSFALGNFIVSVLLARWLPERSYGAYAVAFAILLAVAVIHSAFVIEPMLVHGGDKYRDSFATYLRTLTVYGHFGITAALSLVLMATALAFFLTGASALAWTLVALAAASPFILLRWFLRRALYVQLNPGESLIAGLAYLALLVGGTYALKGLGWLSAPSVFILMGATGLIVSVWLVRLLKGNREPAGRIGPTEILRDHWGFGRWALGVAALRWLQVNGFYLVLPVVGGLREAALLRASMNLVGPFLQIVYALSPLLVASFARQLRNESAERKLNQEVRLAAVSLTGLFLAVYFVIWGFGDAGVRLLYGGRYAEITSLLPLLGAIPFVIGVSEVFESRLRALNRPNRVFWVYAAASLVIPVIVVLASNVGVRAVIGGVVVMGVLRLVALIPTGRISRAVVAQSQ